MLKINMITTNNLAFIFSTMMIHCPYIVTHGFMYITQKLRGRFGILTSSDIAAYWLYSAIWRVKLVLYYFLLHFINTRIAIVVYTNHKMRPSIFLMRGRAPQNPEKVPFKMQMPMELKNRVTGKGSGVKERGCLYEISLVLSCLQQHNFEETYCTKEVTSFHNCYKTFLTNKNTAKEHARKGILTPNTKNLKYNQINQLLSKYPQV